MWKSQDTCPIPPTTTPSPTTSFTVCRKKKKSPTKSDTRTTKRKQQQNTSEALRTTKTQTKQKPRNLKFVPRHTGCCLARVRRVRVPAANLRTLSPALASHLHRCFQICHTRLSASSSGLCFWCVCVRRFLTSFFLSTQFLASFSESFLFLLF